jgi:hypothetical protein
MDKNKKRILNTLKVILIIFILSNLLIIANVFLIVKNKPFPKARACMFLASDINELYIFPLSVFGLDNPLTWPFYMVRNGLFNLGVSLYPKGEGEKEIWWTNIYFHEYKMLVEKRFFDYTIFPGKHRHFTKREIELFHEWPNTLYNHLEPLAFAKISTNDLGTETKYFRFLLVAFSDMLTKKNIIQDKHINTGDTGSLTLTPEEQKIFINLYLMNEKYKKYAKKNEPEILNYVMSDPSKKVYDNILQFKVADLILKSKYRRNELSCSDPYINVFADNHKQLLYYLEHYPQRDRYIASIVAYHSDEVDMTRLCQYNPVLKDYIKYVEKGMGMSINTPRLVKAYKKRRINEYNRK